MQKERKKKKKKNKKKKKRFCCYFHLRRVSLNYKRLIPVLYKREDGGKQERWNETTYLDLIRSNKKGLRHRRFCSFQCYKIWLDCLNFKHWHILSSASGALLIFTVKSTLNYTRVLRQSTTTTTKKKKSIIPRSDAVVCDICSGRTRFGN